MRLNFLPAKVSFFHFFFFTNFHFFDNSTLKTRFISFLFSLSLGGIVSYSLEDGPREEVKARKGPEELCRGREARGIAVFNSDITYCPVG